MIGVDASGQIYDEEFDLFFGMFYFINFKTSTLRHSETHVL